MSLTKCPLIICIIKCLKILITAHHKLEELNFVKKKLNPHRFLINNDVIKRHSSS